MNFSLLQIGPKFRDELKARFGLMRAKEFIMKDLYTFDMNLKTAQDTYEQVNNAYLSFFKKLDIPFVKGNQVKILSSKFLSSHSSRQHWNDGWKCLA